jgi:hypothetical protein
VSEILWGLLGAVVALWLLRPVVTWLIANVFGKAVGEAALASQPDRIHLHAAGPEAWKRPDAAMRHTSALIEAGFQDAGVHTVDVMPGLVVQLLTHPAEAMVAAVYEHPVAGSWLDVVSRYADGRSCTFTSSKPTGLDPRPGHMTFHDPGAHAAALVDRMRGERPSGVWVAITPGEVKQAFEQAYADHMTWLKNRGVSRREVAAVANADLRHGAPGDRKAA